MAAERAPVHVTVSGSIAGIPLTVEVDCAIDMIPALLDRLASIGWQAADATPAPPVDPLAAPTCAVHRRPMKESRRGGWYCPAQNPDGSYCRETAS